MAIKSLKSMQKIVHDTGIKFDHSNCGILHVHKSHHEFAHAHKVKELLTIGGLEHHRLNEKEVTEIEPS